MVGSSRPSAGQAVQGVVIGERHDLNTVGRSTRHQVFGRQRAVRRSGVHVQVYIKIMGNHGII